MPGEKRLAEIDAEIDVVTRQVDGQLEQLVMRQLPDEGPPVGIDRKQIEVVAQVVRIFLDQLMQLGVIGLVAG
jgi:hypothetical protein